MSDQQKEKKNNLRPSKSIEHDTLAASAAPIHTNYTTNRKHTQLFRHSNIDYMHTTYNASTYGVASLDRNFTENTHSIAGLACYPNALLAGVSVAVLSLCFA